jgi:hypothetical protein
MTHEIARLNDEGVLVSIETVSEQDYRTDPVARTVQLEHTHDMRNRLRQYRFNWSAGCFETLSAAAVDVEDRDADGELVEGLIEAIEDIAEHLEKTTKDSDDEFALPERAKRVLRERRRKRPRRKLRAQPGQGHE